MNADTLYWLFSTIAQTYGAIVGIIGMLTIYRLQTLSNQMENCRKNAEESVKISVGLNMSLLDAENLVKAWINKPQDQIRKIKESSLDRFNIINREVEKINKCIKQRNDIRHDFKSFIFSHVSMIILAIILLTQVTLLASWELMYIFIVFLVFPAWLMFSAFIIISLCLDLVKG